MYEKLFVDGIGTVYISRFKGSGMVETGVFLVDVYCLGVKNAFFVQNFHTEYDHRFCQRMREQEVTRAISPACARKLIEGSVLYAQQFGIAPHPDYKKACRVLGGIDATTCQDSFTYGKDGKPFFFQGPNDTPERAQWILRQLERYCGQDKFHFMVESGALPGTMLDPSVFEDETDEPK